MKFWRIFNRKYCKIQFASFANKGIVFLLSQKAHWINFLFFLISQCILIFVIFNSRRTGLLATCKVVDKVIEWVVLFFLLLILLWTRFIFYILSSWRFLIIIIFIDEFREWVLLLLFFFFVKRIGRENFI